MDPYQITFQSWDDVASLYQEIFMDLSLYDDTYDLFCKIINKQDARIFEIGCGPGNITRYLLSKRPDFRIEAIDISPNMISLAKMNNPTAHFTVMDCREIHTISSTFDGIMCGFCLPYLSKEDAAKLISDCSTALKSGGAFYFSAIEGDYQRSGYETSSQGKDKMYVYYHQEDYMQEQLRKNDFEAAQVHRKPYQKSDGTNSVHMIFIAVKK